MSALLSYVIKTLRYCIIDMIMLGLGPLANERAVSSDVTL